MTWRPEDLLRIAKASPERVAAHDRAGWLALFGREAEVEDPVGGPVHRRVAGASSAPDSRAAAGDDPLAAFYDTFIGPNEIRFEEHADAFADLAVARHVTIHTRLSGGLALSIPAYLLYDLVEEDGRLKVRRLAAHWSVGNASVAGLGRGLGGLRSALGQTGRLLGNQGLGGTVAYALGLGGNLFSRPHRRLARFTRAVNQGDEAALGALLGSGVSPSPSLDAPPLSTGSANGALSHPSALLGALAQPGPFEAWAPLATSRSLAFRFRSGPTDQDRCGIAFLERDASPREQRGQRGQRWRLRCFLAEGG